MITVVLNAYKRTSHLEHQLAAIRAQSVPPSKILIWQNAGEKIDVSSLGDVVLAQCTDNLGVWARFAFALNSDTKYVCIFDDDTIPGTKWFENCLETIKVHRGLLGTRGVKFMTSKRYAPFTSVGWDNPNNNTEIVDIVGHSWFFEREWLSAYWRELPPLNHSKLAGEDMHFSYVLQKYLGLSTYVPPHPEADLELWGSKPEIGKVLGSDSSAISMSHDGNNKFNTSFSYYISRGFKILIENQQPLANNIYIGQGVESNPYLRRLILKSPVLKKLAKKIIAYLKSHGIYI